MLRKIEFTPNAYTISTKKTYGDSIKVDPSATRKAAVMLLGDLWELRLPWALGGSFFPQVENAITENNTIIGDGVRFINVSAQVTGLNQARLDQFSQADKDEAYGLFWVGVGLFVMFDRIEGRHQKFVETRSDLITSVSHLISQRPNYGQSRWFSLQFVE